MTNKLPQVAKKCILDDVLKYEQPTKYIVESTNYDDSYNIPVLTAGKSFIIGYTNETEGICDNLPVIIFDDFTTSSQYVDFPFKVKSSAMKILHPTEDANIKYLYYFMQTIQHKANTHKRYWISEYSQRKINLPSKPKQDKIVEKIEEEFGKIDEGVEKLKLAQEQIKQYRQSVLKSAFEGKLTGCEIKLIVLSDAGEIVTGTTPSTKVTEYYNSHDFPFYKPTDLNNGYNTNSAICYVSKSAYENHRKLPINSILVTCIGATIGKTGIIRESGICNQQINAIIPNKEFIPEYIYFQCISDYFQEQIKVNASATTLPILNKSGFSKLKILTCKLNEQKQIVKEIEKRFEIADEVERVITENLEKAEQLKQSILKKAFEARLVPQDPTDQPASELLAQIQAERKNSHERI